MKLNTLLLSSAAVLVAGKAFAADLPSKKAAPASAVSVCKVGDTTGFTLPGSDTCVKINGRVTYDVSRDAEAADSKDGAVDVALTPGFRIGLDALTNTEIGVVRSFIRVDGGDAVKTGKAYLQFAGFTAGVKDSLTDVYGTTGNKPTLAGNGSQGIDYKVSAGAIGFGIGIEDAQNNNTKTTGSSPKDVSGDRPDIVGQISAKAGPASLTVAAVSHQAIDGDGLETKDGYAIKAGASVALGQFNLLAFGGTAKGASAFIGGTDAIKDYDGGEQSESTSYGGEINTKLGGLTVALLAAKYENKSGTTKEDVTEYGVYTSYALTKGLSIQPEFYRTTGDVKKDIIQVRIQRDF